MLIHQSEIRVSVLQKHDDLFLNNSNYFSKIIKFSCNLPTTSRNLMSTSPILRLFIKKHHEISHICGFQWWSFLKDYLKSLDYISHLGYQNNISGGQHILNAKLWSFDDFFKSLDHYFIVVSYKYCPAIVDCHINACQTIVDFGSKSILKRFYLQFENL